MDPYWADSLEGLYSQHSENVMKLPIDKQAHFLGGYALSLTCGLLISPVIGFALAALAGIAKEAIDAMGHGMPDAMDAVATIWRNHV